MSAGHVEGHCSQRAVETKVYGYGKVYYLGCLYYLGWLYLVQSTTTLFGLTVLCSCAKKLRKIILSQNGV